VTPNATRRSHSSVVREQIVIQRIDRRIVDVRSENSFAQVVEDEYVRRSAHSSEGLFTDRGMAVGQSSDASRNGLWLWTTSNSARLEIVFEVFKRNANQLASRTDTRFCKQLLHRGLDSAFREA
jgi:hypothetical protein